MLTPWDLPVTRPFLPRRHVSLDDGSPMGTATQPDPTGYTGSSSPNLGTMDPSVGQPPSRQSIKEQGTLWQVLFGLWNVGRCHAAFEAFKIYRLKVSTIFYSLA